MLSFDRSHFWGTDEAELASEHFSFRFLTLFLVIYTTESLLSNLTLRVRTLLKIEHKPISSRSFPRREGPSLLPFDRSHQGFLIGA